MGDNGRSTRPRQAGAHQSTSDRRMEAKQMFTDEDITRWNRIVDENIHGPYHITGKDRLAAYIWSLSLGRDFMEPVDDYFERRGFTPFITSAVTNLNKN